MTQRELDVDLLKSLSRIEGAAEASGNNDLKQVVVDELDWIVSILVARLKEKQ